MLGRDRLGEANAEWVAEQTGLPEGRVQQLFAGADEPNLYELGEIADALAINPMYLLRDRPSVVARRDSGVDNTQLDDFLERYDYHVSAFRQELGEQQLGDVFSANSTRGARASGESWASRRNVQWSEPGETDPLIEAIEQQLRIPVLIWPIPGAPFGATLRFDDAFAIWVNSHDVSGTQQRFTLAHELGHVMLRHSQQSRIEYASTLLMAERNGTHSQRTEERHASAYAGGILYHYDSVNALWDGEETPRSVAIVAAHLGISYSAAAVAIDVHLHSLAPDITTIAAQTTARSAFVAAQAEDVFTFYETQRGRRRIPIVIEHGDLLHRSLDMATYG